MRGRRPNQPESRDSSSLVLSLSQNLNSILSLIILFNLFLSCVFRCWASRPTGGHFLVRGSFHLGFFLGSSSILSHWLWLLICCNCGYWLSLGLLSLCDSFFKSVCSPCSGIGASALKADPVTTLRGPCATCRRLR